MGVREKALSAGPSRQTGAWCQGKQRLAFPKDMLLLLLGDVNA
jgi:hypothetical protein